MKIQIKLLRKKFLNFTKKQKKLMFECFYRKKYMLKNLKIIFFKFPSTVSFY